VDTNPYAVKTTVSLPQRQMLLEWEHVLSPDRRRLRHLAAATNFAKPIPRMPPQCEKDNNVRASVMWLSRQETERRKTGNTSTSPKL
jgi:hypothetical protein